MKYGYARVSTKLQSVDSQVDQLVNDGIDRRNIFTDEAVSGKLASRPGLDGLMEKVRPGDEVVVTKLDRLGRSMIHMAQIAQDFRDRGIAFKSLGDSIDTSTANGRLMFNMLAMVAEYEREMIVERTRVGLEYARAQGRVGGRKPVMTRELALQVKGMVDGGLKPSEIAKALNKSRATAYRYVDTYQEALAVSSHT